MLGVNRIYYHHKIFIKSDEFLLYRYIYFAIPSFYDYGQFSEVETSIVLSKTILTIEI